MARKKKYWYINPDTGKRVYTTRKSDKPKKSKPRKKKWTKQRKKEQSQRLKKWWQEHPEVREKARERAKKRWEEKKRQEQEEKKRQEQEEKKRQEQPIYNDDYYDYDEDWLEPYDTTEEPIDTSVIDEVREDIESMPSVLYYAHLEFDVSYNTEHLLNVLDSQIERYGENQYNKMLESVQAAIKNVIAEMFNDPSETPEKHTSRCAEIERLLLSATWSDLSIDENSRLTTAKKDIEDGYNKWMELGDDEKLPFD